MVTNIDEKICSVICKSKCCRSTPPALTTEDLTKINNATSKTDWYTKISEDGNIYVVGKRENKVDCVFLSEENLCEIYENRPLDCILFPLFVKIKKEENSKYKIKWYVWYCPLTEERGIDSLLNENKKIIIDYLKVKPEIIFEYQTAMHESGGYKKKHFLKEELLTIKLIE